MGTVANGQRFAAACGRLPLALGCRLEPLRNRAVTLVNYSVDPAERPMLVTESLPLTDRPAIDGGLPGLLKEGVDRLLQVRGALGVKFDGYCC